MKRLHLPLSFLVLLFIANCNGQKERIYKTQLDSIETVSPKTLDTNSPEFMFFGVDENENYFYYLGNDKKKNIIHLSELDSIVVNYRKRYSDPTFLLKECPRVNYEAVKKLIRKLETLGVTRFMLTKEKTPC